MPGSKALRVCKEALEDRQAREEGRLERGRASFIGLQVQFLNLGDNPQEGVALEGSAPKRCIGHPLQ